jgi:uncharacterized protein
MTHTNQEPSHEDRRPVALITGPTSGLGEAFARALAAKGYDLVLVARNIDRLEALGDKLSSQHGTTAEILEADLSTEDGRTAAAMRLSKGVDILVNNAGFAAAGEFWDLDATAVREELAVNVAAVLELTQAAIPPMRAASNGTIINVASVAALISGPGASYNASKAWVVKFSEGLSGQLKGSGVCVQALCPGYMRTEFHTRAKSDASRVPDQLWLEVDDVVRTSLEDALKGRPISIPGWRYRVATTLNQLKPRWRISL